MSISSKIIGPDGLPVPALVRDGRAGLLVATIPARHNHFTMTQFISTDGFENLDVDIGGSGLIIWNGTGVGDVGGDWTQGGTSGQVESAAAMYSGTNGLDTGVRSENDLLTFTTGSAIDLSSYNFLSFWVNTQARPAGSEVDIRWCKSMIGIGNKVKDSDYVSSFLSGTWVNVKIPISDFNLTDSVDQLELKYDEKDGQDYYFDDFELLAETGNGTKSSSGIFRIETNLKETFEVTEIRLVFDTTTTGWNSTDFTTINGGIDSGLLFRWWDPTKTLNENFPTLINSNLIRVMKNNLELFGFFDIETNVDFLDSGRLIVLSLGLGLCPIHLFNQQVLDIVVRDDLSEINAFRAYAIGYRHLTSLQKDEIEDC